MKTEKQPDVISPNAVRDHFDSANADDVVKRAQQLMLYKDLPDRIDDGDIAEGPALVHPRVKRVPLRAYLASALTGLSDDQRTTIFEISERVNEICLEIDIELYEPRKKTDPVHNPEVSDADVFKMDHDRVVTSDLVIHLCHYPSTGAGEELGFAYASLVPIVLLAPGDQRVSRMITGIPSFKLEIRYECPGDLNTLLAKRLLEIRPYLEERRITREQHETNLVGARICDLRLQAGLTRDDLAKLVGLTVESIKHLEENVDATSNPPLTHLRALAAALKTTVAELIVPDLNEYILSQIQSTLYQRVPARFYDRMTQRDRNTLMRRYLYRVLDSLDRG
ncbi:MAG TPA: helix-turn-helix domain-containing protein [Candidatus Acidoferrales bacterium]|jgi:transcriptional regulator with XRE-family HTH domain|nr:helix-turn-helix domain-containing protein [Candidatus Acidoferrales bacterium]